MSHAEAVIQSELHSGAATGLRAVVLAGGKGTRLAPFTVNFPKPLVPLGDTPVVEVLLKSLIRHGIADITMSLGHLSELIRSYFAHRQMLTSQMQLSFVDEVKPTGTAGSLANVPNLNETFLVMNGDLLTDLDFHKLVEFHRQEKALLTIATRTRKIKIDLGVLETSEAKVVGYLEKPEHTYQVSMGIYVYEPEVLNWIKPDEYLDFPDLVLKLLADKQRVVSYQTDCMWLDIGRPDDYARAQEIFAARREDFDHA